MKIIVLDQFLVNFCILCTGLFLIQQFLRVNKVSSNSPIHKRIYAGFAHGLFGVILMHFGISLDGGVLIDLRSVPMMIAALVGGWVSTIVTTLIIIITRLTLYPFSHSAIVNVGVLALSATVFSVISYSSMKRGQKWLAMAMAFVIIICSSIHFVIPDFRRGLLISVQYSFAVLCAASSTYFFLYYLWHSDENIEKLKEFAQTDHLTGLNNARSFDNVFNSAFSTAIEQYKELSLLIIDIDYFKRINDTYGHPAGDEVLKQLGGILVQSCRSVDVVSRNG